MSSTQSSFVFTLRKLPTSAKKSVQKWKIAQNRAKKRAT